MSDFLFATSLILLVLCVMMIALKLRESVTDFSAGSVTGCFDCQRAMPGRQYLGSRTKCFSCERQLDDSYGDQAALLGQPNKCFDCQSQYLTPDGYYAAV